MLKSRPIKTSQSFMKNSNSDASLLTGAGLQSMMYNPLLAMYSSYMMPGAQTQAQTGLYDPSMQQTLATGLTQTMPQTMGYDMTQLAAYTTAMQQTPFMQSYGYPYGYDMQQVQQTQQTQPTQQVTPLQTGYQYPGYDYSTLYQTYTNPYAATTANPYAATTMGYGATTGAYAGLQQQGQQQPQQTQQQQVQQQQLQQQQPQLQQQTASQVYPVSDQSYGHFSLNQFPVNQQTVNFEHQLANINNVKQNHQIPLAKDQSKGGQISNTVQQNQNQQAKQEEVPESKDSMLNYGPNYLLNKFRGDYIVNKLSF